MLLPLAALLVCFSSVLPSDIDTGPLVPDQAHAALKRAAEKAEGKEVAAEPQKADNQTHFFEIKDDKSKVCKKNIWK